MLHLKTRVLCAMSMRTLLVLGLEPRQRTSRDPKGPSSQTGLNPKSLRSQKKARPCCWKMALPMPSEPLRQKPLPVLAARRLDVVSMEIDVRSAKNRASV